MESILSNQPAMASIHSNGHILTLEELTERRDQVQNTHESGECSGLRSPPNHLSSTISEGFHTAHHSKMPILGPGKSLPVHCVVEQVPSHFSSSSNGSTVVEVDSYAIISTSTLFSELLQTAIVKLGYSASEGVGAKGAIQLKKWKPLSLDQITDKPEATVGDILGDIAGIATLRILLLSPSRSPYSKINCSMSCTDKQEKNSATNSYSRICDGWHNSIHKDSSSNKSRSDLKGWVSRQWMAPLSSPTCTSIHLNTGPSSLNTNKEELAYEPFS
ncbi:uncharacterized protein LOC143252813 isoform X3 [Tachypleus tridentatus]|uniref:uncharacterized protein LOC143252813 isoform X3 n=1 Tax=Tachypleus tridentatus TaxID=6853 RepID=UPI003FD43DCA